MPLNNDFYGIYQVATIKTSKNSIASKYPYITSSNNVEDSMSVEPKFFIQGTPLTKILDIGHTSENFTISAPILVPTSLSNTPALQDGVQLLNDIVSLQYPTINTPSKALPLLIKAGIHIGVDNSKIDFTLKSDGDPNNTVNIFYMNPGNTSLVSQLGLNNPSRVANNYDFFVNLGGIKYFVEDVNIDIEIENQEKNFLGVYNANNPGNVVVPDDGTNGGVWPGGLDASYSGWQFPFIMAGAIKIKASGSAAISIDSTGKAINYINNSSTTSDVATLRGNSNVTLQPSGLLNLAQDNFNIFFAGSAQYPGVLPPQFAFNKAVINSHTAEITPTEMKVNFNITAYVGLY